jgi:hypothetical protein
MSRVTKAVMGDLVPPVWLCEGSFVIEETTPIIDIKTECLILERAVYGHCEREVVNKR